MQDTERSRLLVRLAQIERELISVRNELAEERRRTPLPSGSFDALRVLVGNDDYAIPGTDVREIVRFARLTRVPNSPATVEGVLNLRGDVVVVVNVARRLGLQPEPVDLKTPIVVVRMHGMSVGLLVGRVADVVSVDVRADAASESPLLDSLCVSGVAFVRGRLVQVLNLEELLSSAEIHAIEGQLSTGAPSVDDGWEHGGAAK